MGLSAPEVSKQLSRALDMRAAGDRAAKSRFTGAEPTIMP